MELVWGVGFDPPQRFQEQLDKTRVQKNYLCLNVQICDVAFICSHFISCTKFGQLILGKIIIAKRL